MNRKNDGAGGGLSTIDTPLTWETLKAPCFYHFVKCLVPYPTYLLHSINTLYQLHHPILLSWNLKSQWLFHIYGFVLWKDPMQESCLDIKVLYIPSKGCCNMKKCMEQFQMDSGCHGFVIVHTMALGIPLGHVLHLVMYHIPLVIPFSFTYQLAL